MSDWTAGYTTDIDYTYGYYDALNPLRMRLALLATGLAAPQTLTACELGFGQGVSVNMHAAAAPVSWWGTDFNPSQAAFAQELAHAAGTAGVNAALCDQGFAEFCARADLPDFDFIALHGIWSWVSAAQRATLVEFLQRKLKLGGVVYISYNTLPGWSHMLTLQRLLREHAQLMSPPGARAPARINAALGFAQQLQGAGARMFAAQPALAERLAAMQAQDRHYLAHEYFNQDWAPMHFSDVAQALAPAKLEFACPARPLDQVDAVTLTPAQQALLKGIEDTNFREQTRDVVLNQGFRQDYWVKGPRRLQGAALREALKATYVMQVRARAQVTLTLPGAQGTATLPGAVYQPLFDLLEGRGPQSLDALVQQLKPQGLSAPRILKAVLILLHKGALATAQPLGQVAAAHRTAQALNRHLLARAGSGAAVGHLASPVLGAAHRVGREEQLFLQALQQGQRSPAAWARHASEALQAPDRLQALGAQAQDFAHHRLPLLHQLQVVPAQV